MTTDHRSCASRPHWARPALSALVLSVAAAALGAEGQQPLGVYVVAKKLDAASPPSKEELKRAKQSLADAKKATQQLTNTSQLSKVRRDIARVRLVMHEKAKMK